MKEQIEFTLDIYGYEKREYGWVRDNPKGTSQAVTVFRQEEGADYIDVQMFGWFTHNSQEIDYKIYDSGHIGVTPEQFDVLMEVFDQYKNIDG